MSDITKEGEPAKVTKLEDYKNNTKPKQLELFEHFTAPRQRQNYSNTIELYDFTPKYFWSNSQKVTQEMPKMLERGFEYSSKKYTVTVTPARIKGEDGIIRDCYPSEREEIIEDALRKIATEGRGRFLDDRAGVLFNINQIQDVLKRDGKKKKESAAEEPQKTSSTKKKRDEDKRCRYTRKQIIDSLTICAKTSIEIRTEDGQAVLISNMFETLALNNKDEIDGRRTQAFVRFNALVTEAIKGLRFRQYNYKKALSFDSVIARQLYKRMCHRYTQAGKDNFYHIKLTTLVRDLGLKLHKEISRNLRDVKEALEKMITENVISRYEIRPEFDQSRRKGTLADATLELYPTQWFIDEVFAAGENENAIEKKMEMYQAVEALKNHTPSKKK